MRRVVFVSEAKTFGGAEVYLERLAQSLPGWRAVFALPARKELVSWKESLERSGMEVLVYAPTAAGVWRLGRHLRALRPDLVHVNLPSTYDGASGAMAAALRWLTGRPVVTTEHLTHLLRSRRRRWMKIWTARAVSRVVVVSKASRDALVREGMEAAKIVTVPNGVPDPGEAMPWPGDEDPLRIGFLGSLEPRKHADLLVQAAAAAKDTPLRVELGGQGPLRPALERLVERMGQTGRVRFAGTVEDPYAFLGRQHVVALPSRLEGMPLVVLEAFAVGRGVLCSRLPGMDEVVEEGEQGRLLPPEDVGAWVQAIREAAAHRDRLRRWGENARRRYQARFTTEATARATAAVYEQVLAEQGAA